jgi:hypothetical protein
VNVTIWQTFKECSIAVNLEFLGVENQNANKNPDSTYKTFIFIGVKYMYTKKC